MVYITQTQQEFTLIKEEWSFVFKSMYTSLVLSPSIVD